MAALKVALFLEESGPPYEVVLIDTRKGEQHQPDFLRINPNAKTPAVVDGDVTVFDSNAILLYLAEKSGQFLPESTPAARGRMLSWLMFVAPGIGLYSGQTVHFKHFAPEPKEYAVNRYLFEAGRHYGLLDAQLAKHPYMLGETYTLVDMAVWGWARALPFILGARCVGQTAQPQASLRWHQRPPCRAARRSIEIKVQLQGRDG